MRVLLVLCSIAVSHALFWAVVLLRLNHRLSNRLLAVLLILLSLRVGKSPVGLLYPELMYFSSSIGVGSMALIGPVLFLFTQSFFERQFRITKLNFLHLAPGLVLCTYLAGSGIASIFIPFETTWLFLNYTYLPFTFHMLFYIALTVAYVIWRRELIASDDLKLQWITYVICAVTIIWITFICQLFFYQPLTYQLIVITAAVVFYGLSWWAIQRSRLFIDEPRKKSAANPVYDDLGKAILKMIEVEEVFTDPNLTVTSLAGRIKSPPYLVSRAINHCFEKSFSELVMFYRIRKSEQLLLANGARSLTIEAIAYESGFNTLSAFYSAFKKQNKLTPAQFRDGRGASDERMKIA